MRSGSPRWSKAAVLGVVGVAVAFIGCKKPDGPKLQSTGSVRKKVEAEKSAPRLPVLGKRLVEGNPSELRTSADGRFVTVLINAETPQIPGAPPTLKLGDLWAANAQTGQATRVAHGVVNSPGGWLFSADGRWLVVAAGTDPTQQTGSILVKDTSDLSAEPERVAATASYFVLSDDGAQLAYVQQGVLHVGPLPKGPFRQVAGEVATASFAPDAKYLYFRRKFDAAGGLFQVSLTQDRAQPKRIVDYVGDYTVLKSGKHVVAQARERPAGVQFQLYAVDVASLAARKLTDDAARFRVSRDGKYVAWRALTSKNIQADIGELWLAELPNGTPTKLGDQVKDFEFSSESGWLIYRERFEELLLGGRDAKPEERRTEKVGDLYLLQLPDGQPKLLQRRSPNFLFSPDGKSLAYTGRIELPEVTRRLFVRQLGQGESRAVKDWLYEYQFRPGTDELLFRADCMREGRSCDLLSIAVSAPKETLPTKLSEGTFGAKFSQDGKRAALAFAHLTDQSFDLAIKDLVSGTQRTVDQFVEWPAVFLGEKGEQLAYLVKEKQRPGLYVAPTGP